LGGDSIVAADNYPHKAAQTGSRSIVIPRDVTGGIKEIDPSPSSKDRERFERLKRQLVARMEARADLRRLLSHVRFSETREGLRIDLVDEADFSMFRVGTDELVPEAARLIREVAEVIGGVPNDVIIRGHTDALPYAAGGPMNNWRLSTARAETTRATLHGAGIRYERFARIEGVADREPFAPQDRYDPRNRRMSITLAWQKGGAKIQSAAARPAPHRPSS
jgi:chemotaxis protein MotB